MLEFSIIYCIKSTCNISFPKPHVKEYIISKLSQQLSHEYLSFSLYHHSSLFSLGSSCPAQPSQRYECFAMEVLPV